MASGQASGLARCRLCLIDHDSDYDAPHAAAAEEEVGHVRTRDEPAQVAMPERGRALALHTPDTRAHPRPRRAHADPARRALTAEGGLDLCDGGVPLEVHRIAAIVEGRVGPEVVAPVLDP